MAALIPGGCERPLAYRIPYSQGGDIKKRKYVVAIASATLVLGILSCGGFEKCRSHCTEMNPSPTVTTGK